MAALDRLEGFEALGALPDKERGDPGVLGWDLGRVERLLDRLGHPERTFRVALIAGSKGKGSTAAMLASILQADGHRVGLFTQPHLHRYAERIRIDGRAIEPETARRGLSRVLTLASEPVTAFEVVTALAWLHFAAQGVDVAVVEVGMGGRLDATAVLKPALVLFTPIELEHVDVLGPTLADIVAHKAAVARQGVPALTAPQLPEVAQSLPGTLAPPLAAATTVALRGRFQRSNAALAASGARLLGASERAIQMGLAAVRWPGRLEVVAQEPLTVVDGAHTPGSARALSEALTEEFEGRRLHLVIGVAADKDLAGIAHVLGPAAVSVWATRADDPRALSAAEVARAFASATPMASVAAAVDAARAAARAHGLVCVTGSLRVVAEAREALGLVASGDSVVRD